MAEGQEEPTRAAGVAPRDRTSLQVWPLTLTLTLTLTLALALALPLALALTLTLTLTLIPTPILTPTLIPTLTLSTGPLQADQGDRAPLPAHRRRGHVVLRRRRGDGQRDV